MNWDDIRFVVATADAGSLLAAAKRLGVDHSTVGRRIDAAEHALGTRLFTRTRRGVVPTADGTRLLASMRRVEAAVGAVERDARAQAATLAGTVRVTAPETFGAHYLASRLARLQSRHTGLVIELVPSGEVFDLVRQEAEVGVRTFRSDHEGLVVRRLATLRYGLYAAPSYLARRPVGPRPDLRQHAILSTPPTADEVEQRWLARLAPGVTPAFVSPVSSALREAARGGAGLAILPRYLGDEDPTLRRVPMPEPPSETVWTTVHRDLRTMPRVRAVLDFLAETTEADTALLAGEVGAGPS